MAIIVFLGPPGVGKGTVAKELSQRQNYGHISTGDLLRAEVRQGTPLGLDAKKFMESGKLVPDELVVKALVAALKSGGTAGRNCVLDGFPRNVKQAEMLDQVLGAQGLKLATVILLDAPEATLIERLCGRRVCKQCGEIFHMKNRPPPTSLVCPKCQGQIYQRADDSEKVVRDRLVVYQQQTAPLIAYYETQGLLSRVDCAGEAADNYARLKALLASLL